MIRLNPNTDNETLHMYISLTDVDMVHGWASIGFGQDMRNSEFIVVHQFKDGAYVNEHRGTQYEYGPPLVIQQPFLINVINCGYFNKTLFAEISRPTKGDAFHIPIDTNAQYMVWAFNKK
ncbi:hypothetical protein HDU92_002796, partial [Lobulomyces angularis]